LKEPPSFPPSALYDLRQAPLVVRFSDFRWTAAPHRTQSPGQTNRLELPEKVRSVKDDIVGLPDELALDFLEYLLAWTTPRQTPLD
jgi:hypothetical protein